MLLLAASLPCLAADWPQFRGPARDGVSAEKGIVAAWTGTGARVLWRKPLGDGYSGIAAVGDRLYTMYGRGDDEFVVSLDANTGREVWRVRVDDKWRDSQGDGPRMTPTIDRGTAYVVSANGKLWALSTKDGSRLWMHDLRQRYGARIPRWGYSGSPLVEQDRLLVEVGGAGSLIVAFDKKTGREAWRALDGKPGYSSPLAIEAGGVRQVLFFAGRRLYSVSPRDGSVHWQLPWKTSYDVNAAMPVFVPPDKVFVSSGYDTGSAMLKLHSGEGGVQAQELWRTREMKNKFSSSVLHDGYLYGFDNGTLKCLDVRSGETRWRTREFGFGSLIVAEGHLIVLGDKGQLALVEATPEGFREKTRARVLDGKTWSLPTLAGGRLYVRDQSEIVALDVSG